jgi:cytochrome P450
MVVDDAHSPYFIENFKEQCYGELHQLFKGCNECEIMLSDIGRMKILERVIKETLRLRPPTLKISRTLDEEIILGQFFYWYIIFFD